MKIEEFLSKFPPPGRLVMAKLWGSRSHNTHKDTSDYDFSGVYICPTEQMVGLKPPIHTFKHDKEDDGEISKDLLPDYQFFEIGRFCELLMKGNPGILEMLFTDRHLIVGCDDWKDLVDMRDMFLTKQTVHQYLGYMNGQLKRLIAHKPLHTTGGVYNEKWAYHILRLAEDAKRIAVGKPPLVWKEGAERDFLMRVRNMEFSWQECQKLIESAITEVEAMKPFKIPDEADSAVLNKWLVELRRKNWY